MVLITWPTMKPRTVDATEFKAGCLRLMNEVAATRRPLVITKHRKPVVRLMPLETKPKAFLGRLKGKFEVVGDDEAEMVGPIIPDQEWDQD